MPELPEVETMVRDLAPRVVGRAIETVEAPFPGSVRWPTFEEFRQRVIGRRITDVGRRGKYAILTLQSGDALIIHRGMSGSLLLRPADAPMESHVRILFGLEGGDQLRFDDARKFGRLFVMDVAGEERTLPWARMGPEPLDDGFSLQQFSQTLRGRKALIKPLLLNQQVVAGLGNIYVDEALHQARIHPERRAYTLDGEEIERLHRAIRDVLDLAVQGRGTTFNSYRDIEGREGAFQDSLQVFRRAGANCPRCGTSIIKLVVGGRGTHVCPACQRLPHVRDRAI